MEDGRKISENEENARLNPITVFLLTAWVLSMGGMYLYMTTKYEHELRVKDNEKYYAIENAKHKFRSSIADAPIISNSLIATTCFKSEVLDTYFAKGSYFKHFVEELVVDEGLENAWWLRAPLVDIKINGGVEGVHATFHMVRPSYLQFNFPDRIDTKKSYSRTELALRQEDIYFQSYITCAWQEKSFPAGTSFEEVAAWLELQTRALCQAAKIKNKEVLDKVREKLEREEER